MMVYGVHKYACMVVCLRWREGDESLWSQSKFGFLLWGKGRAKGVFRALGSLTPHPSPLLVRGEGEEASCFGGGGVLVITVPYHVSGSVRVSGVWVRARKLEGELDVGGRRIV